MAATIINLRLKQSVTFQPEIYIRSKCDFSLVGWKAWSQWRPTLKSPVLLADLTTENGGIEIDTVTRKLKLVLTDEKREAILATGHSRIVNEIFLISPTGRSYEWVKGDIEIDRSVIRSEPSA